MTGLFWRRMRPLWVALLVVFFCGLASTARTDDEGDQPAANRREGLQPVALGDLSAMRERRIIRILASPDDVLYRLQRQDDRGLIPQLARKLEQQLNAQRAPNQPPLKIVMVPTPPDQIMPRLLAGQGDIAAQALPTETPKNTLATLPVIEAIEPVLVTRDNFPTPNGMDDLSGKTVLMIAGHPGRLMLSAVNADLQARNQPPINWGEAPEGMTENGLLDLVRIGALDGVIVENYLARLWDQWQGNLTVHHGLNIDKKADLSWYVRADSPDLLTELNRLIGQKVDQAHQGWLDELKKQRRITQVTAPDEIDRFEDLWPFFRDLAPRYGFDPYIIAGLAYQESRLKQAARGSGGATGIMQLMPATGNHPALGGIKINGTARDNIEAGLRYLKMLGDRYLDDPLLNPHNRSLMMLLAYHRGPAALERARALSHDLGLNDLVWFNHTDQAVARMMGQEPVEYVRNIAKYAFVFEKSILENPVPTAAPLPDAKPAIEQEPEPLVATTAEPPAIVVATATPAITPPSPAPVPGKKPVFVLAQTTPAVIASNAPPRPGYKPAIREQTAQLDKK